MGQYNLDTAGCRSDVISFREVYTYSVESLLLCAVTIATVNLHSLCWCSDGVRPSVCLCRSPNDICVVWSRRGRKHASEVRIGKMMLLGWGNPL